MFFHLLVLISFTSSLALNAMDSNKPSNIILDSSAAVALVMLKNHPVDASLSQSSTKKRKGDAKVKDNDDKKQKRARTQSSSAHRDSYRCTLCETTMNRRDTLHVINLHQKKIMANCYDCCDCHAGFKTKGELEHHQRQSRHLDFNYSIQALAEAAKYIERNE
jgi:hypothetical protein